MWGWAEGLVDDPALTAHPRAAAVLGAAAQDAYLRGDYLWADRLTRAGLMVVSPTLCAFGAYVAGEIDNAAGHRDRAEQHYARAIAIARSSGATFVDGIASVGLLTVRADAGRIHDALRGYREVIDYFARTGNWTHQWVTLRNLARLLRRLGDPEPAELLDVAVDGAPDAPGSGDSSSIDASARTCSPLAAVSRAQALDVARRAIERNLALHTSSKTGPKSRTE